MATRTHSTSSSWSFSFGKLGQFFRQSRLLGVDCETSTFRLVSNNGWRLGRWSYARGSLQERGQYWVLLRSVKPWLCKTSKDNLQSGQDNLLLVVSMSWCWKYWRTLVFVCRNDFVFWSSNVVSNLWISDVASEMGSDFSCTMTVGEELVRHVVTAMTVTIGKCPACVKCLRIISLSKRATRWFQKFCPSWPSSCCFSKLQKEQFALNSLNFNATVCSWPVMPDIVVPFWSLVQLWTWRMDLCETSSYLCHLFLPTCCPFSRYRCPSTVVHTLCI